MSAGNERLGVLVLEHGVLHLEQSVDHSHAITNHLRGSLDRVRLLLVDGLSVSLVDRSGGR